MSLTYHALGYWGLPALIAAALLLRILPRDSHAHRLISRAALLSLLIVAAIVGLSY
ncbi:hypothetical protein QCN29_26870 [Streptomyces sp. HNM0663]|uniref:Uncharacterized protein n=1 Tax=Streptomyces chengmaiensis TaxID=3040919 RepID=A0ABT6HVB8_9ACTN|nr:hypothetical protein [Streptomyces chengmaiensis]MDH2392335.1 hypothetical protein [Streptomyces chengmaiensis]